MVDTHRDTTLVVAFSQSCEKIRYKIQTKHGALTRMVINRLKIRNISSALLIDVTTK
jgi:hypothetical protein